MIFQQRGMVGFVCIKPSFKAIAIHNHLVDKQFVPMFLAVTQTEFCILTLRGHTLDVCLYLKVCTCQIQLTAC